MKKILAIVLSLSMIFVMASCGGSKSSYENPNIVVESGNILELPEGYTPVPYDDFKAAFAEISSTADLSYDDIVKLMKQDGAYAKENSEAANTNNADDSIEYKIFVWYSDKEYTTDQPVSLQIIFTNEAGKPDTNKYYMYAGNGIDTYTLEEEE